MVSAFNKDFTFITNDYHHLNLPEKTKQQQKKNNIKLSLY